MRNNYVPPAKKVRLCQQYDQRSNFLPELRSFRILPEVLERVEIVA